MSKIAYVVIGLLMLTAACKKSERETSSGLKYTLLQSGNGETTKKGNFLVFHFQLKDNNDSVWNESYEDGLPLYMEMRDTSELRGADGITQMLTELSPGDSAKTTMATKTFFETLVRQPIPPGIDTAGTITYTIKVIDSMEPEAFFKWREKEVARRDENQIKEYLAENGITAQRDTSGIYYVIHNSTGSEKPTPEQCVEVRYEGKFMQNGRPFDANERIGFSLNEVIPGWRNSIPMLAKGDSGTFFIPSKLAYGPRGYPGAIPPDAVLIFDVQLLNFSNEVDPATRTCK